MPVVRTFGTSSCLMLIWHEAHPSSPPRLLQIKGTGRAPKWLSRANIPGGKPIVNTTRWQTMGQNHNDRTDWIQVLKKELDMPERQSPHVGSTQSIKQTMWLLLLRLKGKYSLFCLNKKKKLFPFLFIPLTSMKRLRVRASSPGSFCANWKLAGRRDELETLIGNRHGSRIINSQTQRKHHLRRHRMLLLSRLAPNWRG